MRKWKYLLVLLTKLIMTKEKITHVEVMQKYYKSISFNKKALIEHLNNGLTVKNHR